MQLKSQIRKHYFLNKYVIITPSRSNRPRDIKEQTIIKRVKKCPFCPENIINKNITDRIDDKNKNWNVLSLKNIFPSVTLNNPQAYGVQEVIVDTPKHGLDFGELPIKQIENVLKMYAKRTKAISENKKIEYILIFKNKGSKSGASIQHSHSQIFATSLLPPDVYEESEKAKRYKIKYKRCVYCDIIKKEMNSERKIFENNEIAVFAPYASEFHFETWFFAKRHIDNITQLNKKEIRSLAVALKMVLIKIHKLNLSYNLFIHQIISDTDQHFYLKLQPRESIWGGIELGSGIIINSILPEKAAEFLREK